MVKSKIEAVILDMDGTMLDTERMNAFFLRDFLNELGYNPPNFIEWYYENSGNRVDIMLKKLKKDFGIDHDSSFIQRFLEFRANQYIKNPPQIKKGLIELLDYLKAHNKKIAICSSARLDQIYIKMKSAGVSLDYFDEIIDGSAVCEPKPHPQAYLISCEKLGVKPENALAVEDSDVGVESAYNAGVKVILVPDVKEITQKVTKLAYHTVKSLDMIIPILNKSEMIK